MRHGATACRSAFELLFGDNTASHRHRHLSYTSFTGNIEIKIATTAAVTHANDSQCLKKIADHKYWNLNEIDKNQLTIDCSNS